LGLTIAVIVVDVPSNDIAVLRPLMPARRAQSAAQLEAGNCDACSRLTILKLMQERRRVAESMIAAGKLTMPSGGSRNSGHYQAADGAARRTDKLWRNIRRKRRIVLRTKRLRTL